MTDTEFAADTAPDDADEAELARLAELAAYRILDTAPEPQFDMVTELARALFATPTAAISLIDGERQWMKSRLGDVEEEMPREMAFCNHTIRQNGAFIVADARQDSRFRENPLVTCEQGIRFYAGVPLTTAAGHALGAVCVISDTPREQFSAEDVRKLIMLGDIARGELELRQHRNTAKPGRHISVAYYRSMIGMNYAALLGEVTDDAFPVDRLALIAEAAWDHHREAGEVLNEAIRALRRRLPVEEYRKVVDNLKGFSV